jgi:hypothetical protein
MEYTGSGTNVDVRCVASKVEIQFGVTFAYDIIHTEESRIWIK